MDKELYLIGKPHGRNIRFAPVRKEQIIGDNTVYLLYGKVLAVGDKVEGIEVGNTIEYTEFALNKTILENGEERFYVLDDDGLILNVWPN